MFRTYFKNNKDYLLYAQKLDSIRGVDKETKEGAKATSKEYDPVVQKTAGRKISIHEWAAQNRQLAKPTSFNNGGQTNYYDLPPESQQPTINDLIEHKKMPFWRGEAFKALYALEERASRSKDSSSSEVRELNKVIYYMERRKKMLLKDKY